MTREWSRLPVAGRFVLIGCLLHPLAWAPVFLFDSAPRVAVTLALAPLGLVSLARLTRRRDAPAVAAAVLCLVIVVAAFTSPAPINAVLGSLDWWVGAVGLIAALSWWALGREMSQPARAWLLPVLTIGAAWNGVIALLQVLLQIEGGTLASFRGRAAGTMLNPVYYGAFMSGVLAGWLMLAARSSRVHLRRDAVVVLMLATATGLSGGRAMALAVVLATITSVAVASRRGIALLHSALVVAGMAAASLIVSLRDAPRAVGSRIGSADGFDSRWAIWRAGLEAVRERPWFGWGPANIEVATERQFDLDYTRRWLTDDGIVLRWADVHNMPINVLISVGVVGALVAVLFVALSARKLTNLRTDATSAALLAAAVTMAINWMLQPWTIHTIPIALLLVGASMPRLDPSLDSATATGPVVAPRRSASALWSMATGVVLAVALLGDLLVVDLGIRSGNLDTAAAFARYGYSDAFLDDRLAQEYRLAIVDRDPADALERSGRFARRALDRYPVHNAAAFAGENAYTRGDIEAAIRFEQKALGFQPWNPVSHRRLLLLASATGDDDLFASSMLALCDLGDDECDETLAAAP